MTVTEIAKIYNTTDDYVLKTLKSLKLKAKGTQQELNAVVASVLKSELNKHKDTMPKKGEEKSEKETTTKKKAVKKKAVKKEKEDSETSKEKPVKEKVTKVKETKVKETKVKESKVKETKVKKSKVTEVEAKKTEKPEATTTKKKATTTKKVVTKEPVKAKVRISNAPVITLKPLSRKRRKPTGPGSSDASKTALKHQAEKSNVPTVPEGGLAAAIKEASAASLANKESSEQEAVPEKWIRDESLPDLEINLPVTVKELAIKMQQKPSFVLKELMKLGILAHINQNLDGDIVSRLTIKFGYNLAKIKTQEEQLIDIHKHEEEDPKLLKSRAPVVTFMGHVDHGKTTLVDRIRKTKVADAEHGGITQHMGAYSVDLKKGRITFLDTPGHEAFTSMRARGAHITDLVVLVVAADDGIMPQTQEAIDHARAANVPIVVALTKIDLPNADCDRVKKQLAEINLAAEDWGGKTVTIGVSAITGEGVDELLELILLESEMLELKANTQKKASGIVVEAHMSQGKGAVTTMIVQSGTLNAGEFVVVGPYYGKVRAMFDDHARSVTAAGPSMPVEVLGLSDVPEAGDMFYVVEDEKRARDISFKRQEQLKDKRLHENQKLTLEDLHAQLQEGAVKELNVVLKSDVQGSLEALKDSLSKIPSDKVKIKFIHVGVGEINTSDVLLAAASKAIIIAFHVGTDVRAKEEVRRQPVEIREYRIIYDAVTDIKQALEGLLEAKTKKNFLGRAEIRQVFKLSKHGIVAGCYLMKGKVHRKAHADVIRNEEVVFSGKLSSLKRFKDDVKEVTEGMECGIVVSNFDKYQSGDIIEMYELESVAQKL